MACDSVRLIALEPGGVGTKGAYWHCGILPRAKLSARNIPLGIVPRMFAHVSHADANGSMTSEWEATVEAQPVDVYCHIKNCEQLATERCMRCGQSFCLAHIHRVSIMRRAETRPPGMSATVRLPIRTETYALCARCSSKPVPGAMRLPSPL